MAPTETHRLRLAVPQRPATAPATAQPSGLHNQESHLWALASQQARLGAMLHPGLVAIVEKVGPCPVRGEILLHYSKRISPAPNGAPPQQVVDPREPHRESIADPLVRHAHALFDQVGRAIDCADPLRGIASGAVRRSMQRMIDGTRCIGFCTARRTAAIDLEFSVWIDAQLAQVVRVDYRSVNHRTDAGREPLSSVYGMRRFALDQLGRRVLRSQTDRITFRTEGTDLPSTGFAERTSAYSEHWGPRPPLSPA